MKLNKFITTALAAVALSAAASTASAQNPGFEAGNLILGFQTTGSGSGSYVLANIGDSTSFRDFTTNQINIININSALVAQFGSAWFDRTDLFVGVGASWSNDEFAEPNVRNGDPFNTIYIGNPRQNVGTAGASGSNGFSLTGNQVQEASNGLFVTGDSFETRGTSGVSTISSSASLTDYNDQNPISGGVQGNAYNGVFSGGVQDVFGAGAFGTLAGVNAEAALDLYRIESTTGLSEFQGTVVLDNLGNVSFITVPEPSTYALLGLGALGVAFAARRRSAKLKS
jgi:hypothetical protein